MLTRFTICVLSKGTNFGFSHLGLWSGNFILIAPFSEYCLLVPFSMQNVSKRLLYMAHR